MSLRRAAPGPQVSAGRLRVDAGKAIAKLREYQLADRTAWVLEAIRAAVASRATAIELRADANDVWLAWQGEPWPDDVLPRLFDELVSPEAASNRHHVRLLAAAINSALGMRPAYIDIVAVADGHATRVRYTPEIFVDPTGELGDSALRPIELERVAPPDRAPARGMYLHLRRRLADWRVFGEAPEVALARRACRDIVAPLRIDDVELHRERTRDLLRVPLGGTLDGFLAVTDVADATATVRFDIAERGVLLTTEVLPLFDTVRSASVPIRVFLDADRMPTNASRSQVRRDVFPVADAERRARELIPTLVSELVAAVQRGSAPARAAAVALLATQVGGPRWHVEAPGVRGPLRELAQLPLVENAVGQPRSLTSHWRAEVHTGRNAFAEELAPWLDTVLWAAPDDPAALLIAGYPVDTAGTRRLARYARRQLRAQKRFFAHGKREVRVLASAQAHVRVPLGVEVAGSCVSQDVFREMTGEVCIYREGNGGALAILLDGRHLDRVEFDSPLAFDVVIESARVTPGDRYRGVKRDAEYQRVERAARTGLVRALEAHALATRDRDDAKIDADSEARLFRKGLGLIGELGLVRRGPLTKAPAYRTTTGAWVSFAELAAQPVIGVAPPNKQVTVPTGRTVVVLDEDGREALAGQIVTRIVAYRRAAGAYLDALAAKLAAQTGCALVIREAGLAAALAPASRPRVRHYHVGTELGEQAYLSAYVPCTIDLDADSIVPSDTWSRVADAGSVPAPDYAAWELALVRAIARALLGDAPNELVVAESVHLDSKLGRVLCHALAKHDPGELLGAELVTALRTAPLVRVLGSEPWFSIAQVAERFPAAIPYVDAGATPSPDYAPIVASERVATALARLVGRDAVDGTATLEEHHRAALHRLRLTAHRGLSQQPITVPAADHVAVTGPIARGVVGLWDGPFEIRVFVEGRPFCVLHPADRDLPLVAAVEIAIADCDATFEQIPANVQRVIAIEVRAQIPALLAELATRTPHVLGDQGPARTLLTTAPITHAGIRATLLAAPAFPTIQGGRISLEEAAEPRRVISVAGWHGEWLGRADDESEHALDAPVLYVPDADHELSRIVDKLHAGATIDVTDQVGRLQARRRIARGLVPSPTVRDVPADLKRTLASFGAQGTRIGIGEIALVEDGASRIMVHEHGSLVRTDRIDVLPPIALAVELGEAMTLEAPVQELAIALVREVLHSIAPEALPARIQRNLMRAALARRLDPHVVAAVPLWRDFHAQLARFGNAWVMTEPTELEPLDDQREVFFFERATFDLARDHGWHVVDASKELALDAIARKNQARRAATTLELPSRAGVLAELVLDGDGITAPRGVIGVLAPAFAHGRGVWPHKHMHPFDRVDDPCKWPTLAVIDDARLAPDRTWSAPLLNDVWQAIAKELRNASERALAMVGEAPDDALASLRINNHACADVAALRKAPKSLIRGIVWLSGAPLDHATIQVAEAGGVRSFTPPDRLPLAGKLIVHAPDGLDVETALNHLCGQTHGKLVRQLLKDDSADSDLVAAHVAHALAVRTLRATDARTIEFACFSPRPLDARALTSLLRRTDPVTAIKPGTTPDPDPHVVELVEDGCTLARTIIEHLGARVRRQRPAPKPRPVAETTPPPPVPKPSPPPAPAKRAPPPKPHALQPFVVRLRRRLAELGIAGYRWSIVDSSEPMFAYADGIEVAGDNVRLRALAAAVASNTPFAEAGIDVVVAHLVTVLNVALTQITDASEAHALGVLLADRPQPRRS